MSLNIIDTIYSFIDKLKEKDEETKKIINITEEIKNYTIYNKQFKDEKNEIKYSGKINYNYLDIEYTFILIQTTESILEEKEEKKEKIGYIFLDSSKEVINKQKHQIGNPSDKKYCIFIHDIYSNRYNRICPELSFIQNKEFCNLPNTKSCNKLKGILSLIGNFLLNYEFKGDFIVQDNSQIPFKIIDQDITIKKENIKDFKEHVDKYIKYPDPYYKDEIMGYIFMKDIFNISKYYFYIITHYEIEDLNDKDTNFTKYFKEKEYLKEIDTGDFKIKYTDDIKKKYQEIQNLVGQVYTYYYIDLWLYKRLINRFIDFESDEKLKKILISIHDKDELQSINERKYLFDRNTISTYSSFNIYFIEKKDAIIFNYIIEQIKENFELEIDRLKTLENITNVNIKEVNTIFDNIQKYTINKTELRKIFGEEYITYLKKIYHIEEEEIKCKDLLSQINNYLKSYDINNFTCKLQGGKNYYNKYIKYKLKYLNLKNKI